MLSSTHFIHLHDPQLDENVFHFDHRPGIAAEIQVKIVWVTSARLFTGQGAPPPPPLYPFFLA